MRDPRIGLVTITGVKMSPDLREARRTGRCTGTPRSAQHTAAGLEKARGYLRREIGPELKLPLMPDLRFIYDEAIDRGERIEQLLGRSTTTTSDARGPEAK